MDRIERPNQILKSLRGLDGRRVPLIREETYQKALAAVRKVMRDDHRISGNVVESGRRRK